jgi:carbon monoxide dehydrogenase subunit G
MLPDQVRNGRVHENGDIGSELNAMGRCEQIVVRVVDTDPPNRLVERRVDGNREGSSVFELEPEGDHATKVTLTSEVDVPRLLAAVASGPVRSALQTQLRNLAVLVAAGE